MISPLNDEDYLVDVKIVWHSFKHIFHGKTKMLFMGYLKDCFFIDISKKNLS